MLCGIVRRSWPDGMCMFLRSKRLISVQICAHAFCAGGVIIFLILAGILPLTFVAMVGANWNGGFLNSSCPGLLAEF